MEHKHKMVRQHQSASGSRPCIATPTTGPVFRPAQPQSQPRPQTAGQGFSTPQRQVIQCPNNFQTPTAENYSIQRTQVAPNPLQADHRCYNCGEKGHYASRCPNPRTHANQTAAATLAPTLGVNSVSITGNQNYTHGRVNHVTVEEAQEAPNVVIGMFFINDTSVVVLFDSGASHSFISATYIEKHNLPQALLKCQMIVSSPRGEMPARQL
jgi:hypothetical protein